MKTYKQQKAENKVKKEWLQRVVNNELDDCFGVLHNVYDRQDIFFIDMDVTEISVTNEYPDIFDFGNIRPVQKISRPLCEVKGQLREIKVTVQNNED